MFSSESIIFLTVDIIKLKFFRKNQLQTIHAIHDDLVSNDVKNHNLLFFPFKIFINSLSLLQFCFYASVFCFIFMYILYGDIMAAASYTFEFLNDLYYLPAILLASTFLSFVLMRIGNSWAIKKIALLKNKPFETALYIKELDEVLEPYESLKIMDLLKENQNNFFGLIILQYILVLIEIGYITKSDLLFEPINYIKHTLKSS